MYEVIEDGTAGEMTNDADVFAGPEDHYYYYCIECWHRRDTEGHPLHAVNTEPERF